MPEDSKVDIALASFENIEAVRELWSEYWKSLELPADFQGFAAELSSLPGAYAPPRGRLLIARMQGNPVGTVALRPLSARYCEAKRFYVRPSYQGRGIGKALLARLIHEARSEGYEEMYADTLKSMKSALQMYRQIGFLEVPPYSASPTPGGIFLRMAL